MCIAALGGVAGAIGTIASVGGTIMSVAGQRQAAQAAQARADYQAKQARIQAEDSLRRGAVAEQAQRRKTAALAARQAAVLGASNLDLGSGSPLAILGDTAQLGELDAQTIRGNAQRESAAYSSQAGLFDLESDAAGSAGNIATFGTALGGIGSLAERWYRPFSAARA
jgi:hypothetical protein